VPCRGAPWVPFGFLGLFGRLAHAVERAVLRQDASTGSAADVDAHLAQRRVDAERAQLWILLQLTDRILGREIDLAHGPGIGARFLAEPAHAFVLEAFECGVDGRMGRAQIGGKRRRSPAFRVQSHNGKATLERVGDLGVRKEAPRLRRGGGSVHEHLLDGVVARTTPEADEADLRDLAQTQTRKLSLEIHDPLPDRRRQGAMVILNLLLGRTKEARHARRIEVVGLAAKRALARSSLRRPVAREVTEEHNGP
jgi:hypothetical protein